MLYLAPTIGLAAALGAFTAYDWWWVGLLAAAGVVAGAGIGFGWMLPLLMIPLVATFASPVSSGQYAVAYGVIAAVATGYGIVLARRFGAAAVVEGQRVRAAHATVVALVFGAILVGAAAIGVAPGWTQPYWVPEPILLLALYVLIGKGERILGKAIGTAVGAAAAIPIAIIAPPTWAIALIAAAAFVPVGHANQDLLAQLWPIHVRPRSGPRASRPGRLGGGAAWRPNPHWCCRTWRRRGLPRDLPRRPRATRRLVLKRTRSY